VARRRDGGPVRSELGERKMAVKLGLQEQKRGCSGAPDVP
jgi:hypothetical protein